MLVRGTYELLGAEAAEFREVTGTLTNLCLKSGYQEFIPSALAPREVFSGLDKLYTFADKAGRELCLAPEVTAVVRQRYKESWSKTMPKPIRLFYLTRCYRYDRPQSGRYREFWQFGVEYLGGTAPADRLAVLNLAYAALTELRVAYKFQPTVKRGLGYYVEDGFEAECESLGAQKQVLGGGRYDCGIGWALGVERVILAR